ncbi:MAG TPA: HEAT repeat domain-containing protein, partial [Rhodothermales bacterium]|nr:HEAT repeat domain-containing protein [Rhodothermales bacterium]
MKSFVWIGCFLLGCTFVPTFAQRFPVTDRSLDGLLHRTDLQAIVVAQADRNAQQLFPLLGSKDPAIRARTAFALASVQDTLAKPLLRALLKDPSAEVRADAAFALGQADDSTASSVMLMAFAQEGNTNVRIRLLEALGKKGSRGSLAEVAALVLPTGLQTAQAFSMARYGLRGHHHPKAVDKLAAALFAPNPELRSAAAYYFGRVRLTAAWAFAADRLRKAFDALNGNDPALMYLAAGLARLNDPQDLVRLRKASVSSTDWRIRYNALMALGSRIQEEAVQQAMLTSLRDGNEHVRMAAATVLMRTPTMAPSMGYDRRKGYFFQYPEDFRVSGLFLPLFAATEPSVIREWLMHSATTTEAKRIGLGALGRATDQASWEFLAQTTLIEDQAVATAAFEALAARWRQYKPDSTRAEAYFGVIRQALTRKKLPLSYAAVGFLADKRFKPFGSLTLLLRALQEAQLPNDLEVATEALSSLGKLEDQAAIPQIRAAVSHAHPAIREAAAIALQSLTGEKKAISPQSSPNQRPLDWAFLKKAGTTPVLRFETNRGVFHAHLLTEQAPQTVQTILQLVEEGRYNPNTWHRVVGNFVIQAGDIQQAGG